MRKKDSNFFEEHIEKMVLAIMLLVCLWLFITRVLLSPDRIEYDNKKFSVGSIDNYISKRVAVLEDELNRNPEPKQSYKPRVDNFIALFDSSIRNIDNNFTLPLPIVASSDISDDRRYRIPLIGEVNEVSAEHIRAVAYMPIGEIGGRSGYSPDNSEPNDVDFVTVEAKFDVSALYTRFNESFAGDARFAKPVFAAVQLQRQKLLSDGSWSDWQTVPRTRIDHRKAMFKIIEDVNALPAGGIKVRMLQFDDVEVKGDLLQPPAYQIASAKEQWFPPSLHRTYLEYQRESLAMERREAAAGRREEREAERSGRRSRTATTRTSPVIESSRPSGGSNPLSDGRGGATPLSPMSTRRTQPDRSRTERDSDRERPQRTKEVSKTIDDVYREFEGILITENTDLTAMNTLLFWAHDDTVEPGESYRYKIRLGVFNPIAGTDRFSRQDKSFRSKVILWSNFSDVTEAVNIPGTLYLFPHRIQETARAVTVQVSRYVLGYWYSRDFTVKSGELIGKVSEYKMTEDEEERGVTVPKIVDYAIGAVLVDIMPVSDWSGRNNLRYRHFFEMLYSFNGKDIERLPVETRYWAEDWQSKFNEIKRAEKEPKEPLRDWGSGPTERRRVITPIQTPGGGGVTPLTDPANRRRR